MTDTKPLASLGPSLLARKGGARPAMRPQYGSFAHAFQPEMEDLGWNDMGAEADEQHTRPHAAAVLSLTATGSAGETSTHRDTARTAPEPEVRHQQRKIADAIMEKPAPAASLRSIKPRRSAFEQGRRAAFTLRLDAERHMKLRLATTAQGRSAQQLVTEALDRLLEGIPELESLSAQLKRG